MKNIGVLGGDLRIVKLASIIQKNGYKIYASGLENAQLEDNILHATIKELFENCDVIISGIPISKDNQTIYAPFSYEKILLENVFEKLHNKKIIAGAFNSEMLEVAKYNDIDTIDVLNNEELTILNAIPTAEGAIQIAMENIEFTMHNSRILILGFGRIGKILAKMLYGLGAKVTCEARKQSDLAWIEAYGYKAINLEKIDTILRKL